MKRVAVIGAGQFGHNHARVYSEIAGVELVAVCDINEATGRAVAQKYNTDFVADFRQLIGRVEAVSVAVPTVAHHQIACQMLDAGIAVLVEKPIAATLAEADDMIAAAERHNTVLQVGHLERFNPAVSAASRIITKPRFFEGHRLSIFTPRSLDIDVVMDLMIHDIDVVLSFVRSEVAEIRAAGVPILTPKIDIANARIEFENGCVANLTASRVSNERVRKLRFFQPGQYISLDYSTQETNVVTINHTPLGRPEFDMRLLQAEHGEPLRIEIEAFLAAVEGAPVLTGGKDSRQALALAVGIVEKIQEHAEKIGVPFVG
jgi:predicted dehydrogenase